MLFVGGYLAAGGSSSSGCAAPDPAFAAFCEAYARIQSDYVDDIDPDKLAEGAIRGMFQYGVEDPYSGYMPPQQYQQALGDLSGSFGGIGAEMARHATITATGLPVYFAHPHSPWERGSNENLNRIVREYFPKGTPISSDPKYLAMVACDINDRPRKIHNWKKPSELFTELVESNASTG